MKIEKFKVLLYLKKSGLDKNDIIQGIVKEKELNKIINNIDKYEIYIYKIYIYLKKYSNLPPVEWLKKTKN